MQPPNNIDIIETSATTFWVDEEGIICSIPKKLPFNIKDTDDTINKFKQMFGNKKHCFLIDTTYAPTSTKKQKEMAGKEFLKIVKAAAFISKSPYGKMIAHLFINLSPMKNKSKFFDNEEEARIWLRQYLV